ncbi:MAG: DUF3784 domain-containing protein [Prevotella sp.]|nr:DUF3784 domain-containing protein [Prevotella sp.]
MFWTYLIIGAIFIVLGLLVYRFPRLIAGLSTMSKERMAKVNVEAMKSGMRLVFLIGGAVLLLMAGLSTLVNISVAVHIAVVLFVGFGVVIACALLGSKHDNAVLEKDDLMESRIERIGIRILLGVIIIIPAIVMLSVIRSSRPATIEVSEEYITAKGGGYDASIPINDITEATTLSHWPDISIRTKGVSTQRTNFGHFRLKNGEDCMLFLYKHGGPVLEVRTKNGELYYLNCGTEEETLEMIAKVKQIL